MPLLDSEYVNDCEYVKKPLKCENESFETNPIYSLPLTYAFSKSMRHSASVGQLLNDDEGCYFSMSPSTLEECETNVLLLLLLLLLLLDLKLLSGSMFHYYRYGSCY